MPRSPEVTAAWTQVDQATSALGARTQKTIDALKKTTEGLSGEATDALIVNLTVLADTLNSMGHNPDQPIPAPMPPETPIPIS